MKFFIPFAENKEQELKFYQSIKDFVRKTTGATEFDKRKIRFLELKNEHKTIEVEVGKSFELNDEIVITILYEPFRKVYHICTPSNGVVRGASIIVPENRILEVEDFEVD